MHSSPTTTNPTSQQKPINTAFSAQPAQQPLNQTAQSSQNQSAPNNPVAQTDQQGIPSPNISPSIPFASTPHPVSPPFVNPNPVLVHPMVTHIRGRSNHPTKCLNLYVSTIFPLPKSYRDAFDDLNLQNAMNDEYHALIKIKLGLLCPDLRTPMLFVLEGIDVDETFTPVVKPSTIWTLDIGQFISLMSRIPFYMEIYLRVDIKDNSFNPNSKIELFLFNSNNCISSVKKRSSQDEGNFVVFFHFENNEIYMKSLRVSRDSFAYKEYGIRLMLAPRSAKALQEKVLLKLHGIRKLHGSPSFGGTLFWIIAELSSLRKATEICSILCLLLMSSLRNLP
ncbi:hypothetical protein Tco_1327835 [Tanacetum coccineum]